jgi:hypothetical protein
MFDENIELEKNKEKVISVLKRTIILNEKSNKYIGEIC